MYNPKLLHVYHPAALAIVQVPSFPSRMIPFILLITALSSRRVKIVEKHATWVLLTVD